MDALDADWIAEKSDAWPRSRATWRRVVPAGATVQVMDVTEGGLHALLRLGMRQPTRFLYDFHFFHDQTDPRIKALQREFVAGLEAGQPAAIVVMRDTWNRPGYDRVQEIPGLTPLLARATGWPSKATATGSMRSETILNVIRAYDDWIVRAYCWGRFWILRQRFLDEVGQYLPAAGACWISAAGSGSSPSTTRAFIRRSRSRAST